MRQLSIALAVLAIGLTACGSAGNGSKSTATGNGDAKRDKLAQV